MYRVGDGTITSSRLFFHILLVLFVLLFPSMGLFAAFSESYNFYYQLEIPERITIRQIDNPDSTITYTVTDSGALKAKLSSSRAVDVAKLDFLVTSTGQKHFSFALSPIDSENGNMPYFQSGTGKIYYNMSYTLGQTYVDFNNGTASIIKVVDDMKKIGTEITICTFRITIDAESMGSAPPPVEGTEYSTTMTITYTGG